MKSFAAHRRPYLRSANPTPRITSPNHDIAGPAGVEREAEVAGWAALSATNRESWQSLSVAIRTDAIVRFWRRAGQIGALLCRHRHRLVAATASASHSMTSHA
jgi:hypothetical protein